MKTREVELLKELAKIAGKYKARDWDAAMKLLSAAKSDRAQKKKSAARSPTTKRSKEKVRKAIRSKAKPKAKISFVRRTAKKSGKALQAQNRKPSLQETALEKMLASASPRQLKFAHSALFQAKEVPESRQQLLFEIKAHLAPLSEAARSELMTLLLRQDDPSENYRRWVRIIATPESKR